MKLHLEKNRLLLLLILADLAFLVLHIFHVYTNQLPSSYFSLARDGGFSEFFQYTKEFWIFALLILLGIRQRKFMYVVLSYLFLYFLIDDSFALHENYGALLADSFNFQPLFGLRAIDFGELAVTGFFGVLLFAALGMAYWMSDPAARAVARSVLALVVLLALFGVLADMVEILMKSPGISEIMKMIEETGEMLVMSAITWFVFGLDLDRPDAEITKPA